MTLISVICLLALTSSAFGRSSYSSYSAAPEPMRELLVQQRTQSNPIGSIKQIPSGFGQQTNAHSSSSYGSQNGQRSTLEPFTFPTVIDQQPTKWTNAEIQCRGKLPGTILLTDNGRGWITCLEENKATEQFCQKNLYYNLESRRCERRPGALENPCLSQPCLNNGECLPIDSSSFECKCKPEFDGTLCELDARICQTQKPCGQAPGTRCQSFRSGAALPYVCVHQNELAYGFNAQQIQPSPCKNVEGTFPMLITDRGFIMCDEDRMFLESCPGGTVWHDQSKSCVWPDIRELFGKDVLVEKVSEYGFDKTLVEPKTSYSQPMINEQRMMEPVASYGRTLPSMPMQKTFLNQQEQIRSFPTSSY